jgi:polysaccharide pyruvyl transferase WcaK-like protein
MTKAVKATTKSKGNPEKIRALRLGEVKRVLRHRYRHELPDDDAGRDDLELLLDIVSLARDAKRRMKNIIETWAPWMDTAESYELVENILRKPE